jgi:hypothetical protein
VPEHIEMVDVMLSFEGFDKRGSEIFNNAPCESPPGLDGRGFALLFKDLCEVTFYLFEIILAAEPAKEFKGAPRRLEFHQLNEILGI